MPRFRAALSSAVDREDASTEAPEAFRYSETRFGDSSIDREMSMRD
jgi:hypothetical protein